MLERAQGASVHFDKSLLRGVTAPPPSPGSSFRTLLASPERLAIPSRPTGTRQVSEPSPLGSLDDASEEVFRRRASFLRRVSSSTFSSVIASRNLARRASSIMSSRYPVRWVADCRSLCPRGGAVAPGGPVYVLSLLPLDLLRSAEFELCTLIDWRR